MGALFLLCFTTFVVFNLSRHLIPTKRLMRFAYCKVSLACLVEKEFRPWHVHRPVKIIVDSPQLAFLLIHDVTIATVSSLSLANGKPVLRMIPYGATNCFLLAVGFGVMAINLWYLLAATGLWLVVGAFAFVRSRSLLREWAPDALQQMQEAAVGKRPPAE